MAWYVLRTKPKREEQVEQVLREREVETYLPVLERARPTRAGYRTAPFFPSYMFVSLTIPSEQYLRTRSAPGVVGFVSFADGPTPIPEALVSSIRERLELENGARQPDKFQVGQRVRIMDGPFKDVEAIFDGRLSASGRVRVLIDLLGKQWRVQVHHNSLSQAG